MSRTETRNIQGPKLSDWQKDFMKLYRDHDKSSIFVIKSPRQVGKSFLMCMLLLQASINYKDSISYFISPVLHQGKKVYRDLVKFLGELPVVKSCNNQSLEIFFTNGSEIHIKSAEQKESLRGNTVKGHGVLIIDEAAYVSDDIFATVFPYVNVAKCPIVIVSTPLFKSGEFYNLYSKSNDNIFPFDVCNYDLSQFISEDQKALYRETMPTQQYLSEIEGTFMAEKSGVFGDFANILSNDISSSSETYVGIDWGTGNGDDYTAIVVMDKEGKMVDLRYFNDKDTEQTMKEIESVISRWRPRKVTVEKNSIGNVFGDLLRKRSNVPIYFFNTNNESKNKIINRLQIAIQNRQITLLDDTQLKIQFVGYQIEKTKDGKVTFNGQKGVHDDIVMATAICLDSMQRNKINVSTISAF